MRILIAKLGESKTVAFAASELARYLKKIDKSLLVDMASYDEYDENVKNAIFVGVPVGERSALDRVVVDITDGAGYIGGSNERSALIGVYKFSEHLGCKWLRPGEDGEFIKQRKLAKTDLSYKLDHRPSYRHRGITIEGSCTYESVYDMINWLPKVGLNEYFIQLHLPFVFFDNYYKNHPECECGPVTVEDVEHICRKLEEEIKLRGLIYHKCGHGWRYTLLGEYCCGRYDPKNEIPDEIMELFAEVNGERKPWKNTLHDSNLCYSNPEARRRLIKGFADYAEKTPSADYIHFWMSDDKNNHCECEECQKKIPTDWYVIMLNELDEELTARGLDTKVVFLLYNEFLWAPETEKIKNPDRFVLMFAPITRSYKEAYVKGLGKSEAKTVPYVRNKVHMPKEVDVNVAFLRAWQATFKGESFLFDYHNMWAHATDAGEYRIARVLHDDMKYLDRLKIDGMVSCQLQRAALPTGLPTYAMARALWDKTSEFEAVSADYFESAFERDGEKVEAYLKSLSEIWDDDADVNRYDKLRSEIEKTLPTIKENLEKSEKGSAYELSWKYLLRHAELWLKLISGVRAKAMGDKDAARAAYDDCVAFLYSVDGEVGRGIDYCEYKNAILGTNFGFGLLK